MTEDVHFPETSSKVDISTLPPKEIENILPFKPQRRPTFKNPDWLQINAVDSSKTVETEKSPQELGVDLLKTVAKGFADLSPEGQAAFENALGNEILSVEAGKGESGVSVELEQQRIKGMAHSLTESLLKINASDVQSSTTKTA